MADEVTDTTTSEQATTETTTEGSTLGTATVGADETTTETTAETKAETTAEEKPEVAEVPDAYELTVTTKNDAGEDVPVELDAKLLEEATPLFKDAGLTNEQANKLAPLALRVQERVLQQQQDDFAETRANWAKEAQADTDIGGRNWKDTTSLAAKAMDRFVGPVADAEGKPNAFRQLLNDSGLGEHPEMIRVFRNLGRAIAEDGTFPRSHETGPKVKKSPEENMYPDDVPKK